MSVLHNPKTTHFEFFGPPGVGFISLTVPLVIYAVNYACSQHSGNEFTSLRRLATSILKLDGWASLFDAEAAIAYAGFYAFTIAAWYFLPGEWIEGTELRTGGRLKYKMNAFATLVLTASLTAVWILIFGASSFTFIYSHWVGFCTAAIGNAIAQATYCYVASLRKDSILALGGNTDNSLYDWFIGRELNSRIGSFDIKSFNELRPGLILWLLINISSACAQVTSRAASYPTDSMVLVLLFQTAYILDGIYNEPALLTTMDITTDGFGFMLSIGDLAWVPFTYSLQARYLAANPIELGLFWTTVIFIIHGIGYWIFRDSNNEKNDFRNGKNPKNLTSLQTERGTRLLTSGWWGLCQHPNYLGDLIMAVAWSLPTGFNTPFTYFYCTYFLVLLLHRQMRDSHACAKKYGKDWSKYQKLVPWKIFPYVY
ncbi:erg24, C-14 sterol reductase [Ceratobasidium sp. 428]|nr:erg24, C-14 sterol reductase [Ceratobasidium sp. 395]KAG8738053.1 erg24, C-14 sterol reductase [Ceratobasidium sp. 428]